MKKINELDYDELKAKLHNKNYIYKKGKKKYSNLVFSFDCETSSYFLINKKPIPYNYNLELEKLKDVKKQAELYIWQVSIDGVVYYGRQIKEIYKFFNRLSGIAEDVLLIFYIHNLGYDLAFLFNALGTNYWEIFAREPNKPIKAYNTFLGIEFRCSLMLTNMTLEKLAESRGFKAQKQVGLLDYLTLRTPYTYLTENELKYCEYDCLVIDELIRQEMKVYKSIYGIPLTQTGKVRRHIRGMFWKDEEYKNKLNLMIPKTYGEYKLLESVYCGGYTHSNYKNTNKILYNVKSQDITSSYPYCCTVYKYPMTQFRKGVKPFSEFTEKDKKRYCYIVDVSFKDLEAKTSNSFLSISKRRKKDDNDNDILTKNVIEDNGRIRHADFIRFNLCDVDFETVLRNYTCKYKINDYWIAEKGYLDYKLIKYILDLFKNKTQYKDVAGKEELYRESKEFINSVYGLFVTKFLIDGVIFEAGDFKSVKLSPEKGQEMIDNDLEKSHLLNWAWGVWCSAYARTRLWKMIEKIDENDMVYCDTDSLKYINWEKYEKIFKEEEKVVDAQIKEVCEYYKEEGLLPTMFKATTPKGKVCSLGYFTDEGIYTKFKTLGAKKYIYEDEKGELHITVAGLSKKAVKDLKSIEDFKIGKYFAPDVSGRTIATYNTNQDLNFAFPDGFMPVCKFGIAIFPTSYLLGIDDKHYKPLLESAGCLTDY